VRASAEELGEPVFTDIVDSAGLVMRKDRSAADRGAGEHDSAAYSEPTEVFGVSGALALLRAEAIDALREIDGQVFDEDFFAYKEDVDIAWRLRLLGWSAAYVPSAEAFHYRGTGGAEKAGLWQRFIRRRQRSPLVNRLSTRNQLLLTAKDDDGINRLLHLPWICFQASGTFLSTLVLTPRALGAYVEAVALLPKMLKKRRAIMSRRKVTAEEIRGWFE
jgi:GT2 family glycosyltransferase